MHLQQHHLNYHLIRVLQHLNEGNLERQQHLMFNFKNVRNEKITHFSGIIFTLTDYVVSKILCFL